MGTGSGYAVSATLMHPPFRWRGDHVPQSQHRMPIRTRALSQGEEEVR
jgi:hypothetical protein